MAASGTGRAAAVLFGVAGVITTGACGAILGLDDFENDGGGGSGASAASASVSASASVTGSGTGASGGAGGDGGASSAGSGGNGGSPPDCGNGQIDGDETCDGDCPSECIDPDLCTAEAMLGSAASCDATCPFAPIVACKNDDGCCPPGCGMGNDKDCVPRVMVISWDPALVSVRNALVATGKFGVVDTFSAAAATPTLAELDSYAVVFAYANAGWNDSVAMGDVLADYFDQGGRVVLANGANCADSFRIRGRFEADGYHLFEEDGVDPNPADSTAVELMSPLVVGAETFTASIHCVGAPIAGAQVVAEYADGKVSIVRGKVNGRNRVDINAYPGLDYDVPAVLTAFVNALLYPSDP